MKEQVKRIRTGLSKYFAKRKGNNGDVAVNRDVAEVGAAPANGDIESKRNALRAASVGFSKFVNDVPRGAKALEETLVNTEWKKFAKLANLLTDEANGWRAQAAKLEEENEEQPDETKTAEIARLRRQANENSELAFGHHSEAIRQLLDLSTSPVSFREEQPQERPRGINEKPGGLAVDQQIFLDGPSFGHEPEPMERFAKQIADGDIEQGVYCLAGARGCGKSTVLNRIEWFCKRWSRSRGRSLLVRIDLGCAFDSKKFIVDLMTEICRKAQAMCFRQPLAGNAACNAVRMFVGHVGRWCDTNLVWSLLVMFVAGLFLLTDLIARNGDFKEFQSKAAPVGVAAVLSASIILIGLAYRAARIRNKRGKGLANPGGELPLTVMLSVPLLVLLCLWLRSTHQKPGLFLADNWQVHVRNCVAIWIGAVIGVAGSLLVLPRWWWTYVECAGMLDALRSRDSGSTPDLPGVSQITSVVKLLLPQAAGLPDIRNMDAPFLQQEIKRLLRHCTRAFGGVVILIDDVDVLPSSNFHELFRILRPLSKTKNVRCVVCVPAYFYHAMSVDLLSDVHSTARCCHLLGDPSIYRGRTQNFRIRRMELAEFRAYLAQVLYSRLKIPVRITPGNAEALEPLKYVIDRWCERCGKNDWKRIWSYLKRINASRREIIRECDHLLQYSSRVPFMGQHHSTLLGRKRELERLKDDYNDDENSLATDMLQRQKLGDARAALRPKRKRKKSAPAASEVDSIAKQVAKDGKH